MNEKNNYQHHYGHQRKSSEKHSDILLYLNPRRVLSKRQKITNAGKDVEKEEILYAVGGNVN